MTGPGAVVAERWLDLEGLRSVRVRPAVPADVPAMLALHTAVLPQTAFLPALGPRLLRRLFLAHIEDPGAVAVVAERDGELLGYATGVRSVPAFRRRFLLRHGAAALLGAAPRLVRPATVRRALETLRYPEKTRRLPEAEWDFVGVRRGTAPGLGEELGREVVAALGRLGASEVKGYVTTDNRAMSSLLRRMGFEHRARLEVHPGRPHDVYVYRLAGSPDPTARP